MSVIADAMTPRQVIRTILCEGELVGNMPLVRLDYTPGDRSLTFTLLGFEDDPGATVVMDDTDIRALRDELSAVIWYWNDPEDRDA